jgi:hypothetical protein
MLLAISQIETLLQARLFDFTPPGPETAKKFCYPIENPKRVYSGHGDEPSAARRQLWNAAVTAMISE